MIRFAAVRGVFALALAVAPSVWAQQAPANEDGYDLWLRYRRVTDAARLAEYRASASQLVVSGGTPTINAARSELTKGVGGLLGKTLPISRAVTRDGAIVIGTPATSAVIARLPLAAEVRTLAKDGFVIRAVTIAGHKDDGDRRQS
jgi:alpha-glucuronidase